MQEITPKKTHGERRIPVSSKLRPDVVEQIDKEMVVDSRPSRSNMIEVLVREALDARSRARRET